MAGIAKKSPHLLPPDTSSGRLSVDVAADPPVDQWLGAVSTQSHHPYRQSSTPVSPAQTYASIAFTMVVAATFTPAFAIPPPEPRAPIAPCKGMRQRGGLWSRSRRAGSGRIRRPPEGDALPPRCGPLPSNEPQWLAGTAGRSWRAQPRSSGMVKQCGPPSHGHNSRPGKVVTSIPARRSAACVWGAPS